MGFDGTHLRSRRCPAWAGARSHQLRAQTFSFKPALGRCGLGHGQPREEIVTAVPHRQSSFLTTCPGGRSSTRSPRTLRPAGTAIRLRGPAGPASPGGTLLRTAFARVGFEVYRGPDRGDVLNSPPTCAPIGLRRRQCSSAGELRTRAGGSAIPRLVVLRQKRRAARSGWRVSAFCKKEGVSPRRCPGWRGRSVREDASGPTSLRAAIGADWGGHATRLGFTQRLDQRPRCAPGHGFLVRHPGPGPRARPARLQASAGAWLDAGGTGRCTYSKADGARRNRGPALRAGRRADLDGAGRRTAGEGAACASPDPARFGNRAPVSFPPCTNPAGNRIECQEPGRLAGPGRRPQPGKKPPGGLRPSGRLEAAGGPSAVFNDRLNRSAAARFSCMTARHAGPCARQIRRHIAVGDVQFVVVTRRKRPLAPGRNTHRWPHPQVSGGRRSILMAAHLLASGVPRPALGEVAGQDRT